MRLFGETELRSEGDSKLLFFERPQRDRLCLAAYLLADQLLIANADLIAARFVATIAQRHGVVIEL